MSYLGQPPIYFKRRMSLIPELPFGKNTTTFGDPWDRVFAFKITEDTNIIIDANTGVVLWQREQALR